MTLEEKRDFRNKRCAQFLHKQNEEVFLTYFRLHRDYTRMPAHEVHDLAEACKVEFNDLVVKYGFGAAVITFEIMDQYYTELGNGSTVGAVAMAM